MAKNTDNRPKICDLCGDDIKFGDSYFERTEGNYYHKYCPITANTPTTVPPVRNWMRAAYKAVLEAGKREAEAMPHRAGHWRSFQRGVIALAAALGIERETEAEQALAALLDIGRAERQAMRQKILDLAKNRPVR